MTILTGRSDVEEINVCQPWFRERCCLVLVMYSTHLTIKWSTVWLTWRLSVLDIVERFMVHMYFLQCNFTLFVLVNSLGWLPCLIMSYTDNRYNKRLVQSLFFVLSLLWKFKYFYLMDLIFYQSLPKDCVFLIDCCNQYLLHYIKTHSKICSLKKYNTYLIIRNQSIGPNLKKLHKSCSKSQIALEIVDKNKFAQLSSHFKGFIVFTLVFWLLWIFSHITVETILLAMLVVNLPGFSLVIFHFFLVNNVPK